MVEIFKGCTIRSTISNSAHSNSNKQVDKINDSTEQVDQINDSDKQVDAIINDSDQQVDAISDYEKLVVDGSDPKIDPRAATHTINGISATHTTK